MGLFEEEIMVNLFLRSFANPIITIFFQLVTLFGEPFFWITIIAILFWIGKEKMSFSLATLVIFVSLFTGLAKTLIARPRPEINTLTSIPSNSSMPSGHSSIVGSIYSFYENKIKKIEKYLLLILVLLTGISRIYLGVHFLSDVFVGLLFGYIIGKIYCKLEHKINERQWKVSKFNEDKLYIIIFFTALIMLLFLPEELYIGYILLGYYLGYVIYRNSTVKIKPQNKKLVVLLGLIFFIGIYLIGLETIFAIPLFILDGLFISLIWPFLVEKLRL